MNPSVDIVTVNWNSGDQLRRCLASVPVGSDLGYDLRVVVVDNASRDDSHRGVDKLGLPVTVIVNTENRGFAAACNQGAANSAADYLLFLNPDMALNRDSIVVPLRFLADPKNRRVGICGIQLRDFAGAISRTCARFPSFGSMAVHTLGLDRFLPNVFRSYAMANWTHEETRQVDHVIGAFYLIRRDLFRAVGGFDERFFVYLEDLDLSFQAARAGYSSWYLTEANAFHKGGGTSESVKARRLFYSLRSRILYVFKNFRPAQAWAITFLTLLAEPLPRILRAIARFSGSELSETVQAYAMLWADLGDIMAKAKSQTQRQFVSAGGSSEASPVEEPFGQRQAD